MNMLHGRDQPDLGAGDEWQGSSNRCRIKIHPEDIIEHPVGFIYRSMAQVDEEIYIFEDLSIKIACTITGITTDQNRKSG